MTTGRTLTHHNANMLTLIRHPNRWVKEGWQMARREHDAVFDSINITHVAETQMQAALADTLKAHGRAVLDHRNELDRHLTVSGFDQGVHLHNLAHGKLDLA